MTTGPTRLNCQPKDCARHSRHRARKSKSPSTFVHASPKDTVTRIAPAVITIANNPALEHVEHSEHMAHEEHLEHVAHEEHLAHLRAEGGGNSGGDGEQSARQRMLRRARTHPVAATVTAAVVVGALVTGIALASNGGGSSPSASSGPVATSIADPARSSRCVFQQANQADCTSSDPEITVEDTNYSDTSGCVLSAQITWGDGSRQTFQYDGTDEAASFVASHTYQQQGIYSISFAPTVLSGGCTDTNSSYKFTYSPGNS